MLKLIYIFGHVLIVNSRCYGRCYVKNLIPPSTFLKFHTHLEENSVRSFQNVFDKSSRVLILAFPRNWIFHGHRHILGYHSPLTSHLSTTSPGPFPLSPRWPTVYLSKNVSTNMCDFTVFPLYVGLLNSRMSQAQVTRTHSFKIIPQWAVVWVWRQRGGVFSGSESLWPLPGFVSR